MANILDTISSQDNPDVILQRADENAGMNAQELVAFVKQTGDQLQALGLRRNHKIALALSEGEPSTVVALLASIQTSIAIPLRRFENNEMAEISLDTAIPDALILDDRLLNQEDIKELAHQKNIPVIMLHASKKDHGKFVLESEDDFSHLDKSGSAAAPEEDDIAIIFQTSGTTGTPKLVAHTHGHFLHNASIHLNTLDIKEKIHCLNVLSQRAQWGITTAITTLISGGKLSLYPHPNIFLPVTGESKLPYLIAETQANWVPLTPNNLADMMRLVEKRPNIAQNLRDSSLRILETSSFATPPDLLRQIDDFLPDAAILETFGATETGPVAANTEKEFKYGTVGKIVNGVEIRIVNSAEENVQPGEIGELWVRSPSVARYYDNSEANNNNFTPDGFYKTGDMVKQDEEGFLIILGRKKELIITRGQEILPSVIDHKLQAIHGINRVVTFPIETGHGVDLGIIVIPKKANTEATRIKIQETVGFQPSYVFMDAIPEQILTSKGTPRRGMIANELAKFSDREETQTPPPSVARRGFSL